MAERARLEIECTPKAYRGFKSPSLRIKFKMRTVLDTVRIFLLSAYRYATCEKQVSNASSR